jgi:hypothetical protein
VISDGEYESVLRQAEHELLNAKTADEVRNIWRTHFGTLGHRTLGRLLLGRSAKELAVKRSERTQA